FCARGLVRRALGVEWGGRLSPATLHGFVSLRFPAVEPGAQLPGADQAGSHQPRATAGAAYRTRPDQQRDCESVAVARADRSQSRPWQAAEGGGQQPPGCGRDVPNPGTACLDAACLSWGGSAGSHRPAESVSPVIIAGWTSPNRHWSWRTAILKCWTGS